ncbi:MAG: hypothetical protein QM820_03125 [Minicystis sp.]
MFARQQEERYRRAVLEDSAVLGLQSVWTKAIEVGQQELGDQVGRLARLAITGEAATTCTDVVLHRLDLHGSRMLYVQCFQGSVGLPGYLHARLPGAFDLPFTLRKKLFGVAWHAQDAPAIEARLTQTPGLLAAAKALPWKKHSTLGHVSLAWVLQVRPLGDGTSELIFQLGADATDIYETCLHTCMAVREAMRPALPDKDPPGPKMGLYWPAPYEHLYYQVLCEP